MTTSVYNKEGEKYGRGLDENTKINKQTNLTIRLEEIY